MTDPNKYKTISDLEPYGDVVEDNYGQLLIYPDGLGFLPDDIGDINTDDEGNPVVYTGLAVGSDGYLIEFLG